MLKKILFPFYNSNHQFLMKKWWFRTIFVLYVFGLIFIPIATLLVQQSNYFNNCEQSAKNYFGTDLTFSKYPVEDRGWIMNSYSDTLKNCYKGGTQNLQMLIFDIIIFLIVIHYIIQLIFFKVIINFIVLGGH